MKRQFEGVWIPAEFWLDTSLSPMQKFFILEIKSLSDKLGCFASNKHFAQLFGLSVRQVSRILSGLKDDKWIDIDVKTHNKQVIQRTIKLIRPIDKNVYTPHDKNVVTPIDKNGAGTNTKSLLIPKEKKGDLPFEDFYQHYPRKTNKQAAIKAWSKLSLEDQRTAIDDIRRRPPPEDKNFQPHPSTWLNGKRWEDEIIQPKFNPIDISINNLRQHYEQTGSNSTSGQTLAANGSKLGQNLIGQAGGVPGEADAVGEGGDPFGW